MHDTIGHREPNGQVMLLLLLVVLVFAVPIRLVIPTPGPEFRRGLVCGLELLFVVPYVLTLAKRENFVVLSPAAGSLFAVWLVASVVSVVLSPHVLPAVARQFEWLCHILFAASIWHFLRLNKGFARWAITFVVAGALLSALVVFGAWHGDPANASLHWRRYLPLFTHIRHFGYYLVAGILLAQMWGADTRTTTTRVLLVLPVLCVLWGGLVWTGGRAALASALLGVGVVVCMAAGRRWILVGLNTVSLSVGSIIAVFMAAGRPELGWTGILSRLSPADLGGFATGRLRFWSLAYDNFLDRPLFGFGPDAYLYLEPKIFGSHPHNVVLQFLTDYGLVGALAFGFLALALFLSVVRRAREPRTDLRSERIVSVAVLVAFAANALLDGTFYHATPLMIVAVVLAIGLLPESFSSSGAASFLAVRTGFAGTAVTLVAAFFVVYVAVLSSFLAGSIPAPDGLRARLVRALPMATHTMVLEDWIRAWETDHPVLATDWAHWAHQHSPDAFRFRSVEARLLADQGLYEAARSHAVEALESSTGRLRVAIAGSLQPIIEAADANSGQMLFQVEGD